MPRLPAKLRHSISADLAVRPVAPIVAAQANGQAAGGALFRVIRVLAWLAVAALIVLSIVPPALRPVTPVPHPLEHFASFALAGALQFVSYPGRLVPWFLIATCFCAGIELLQVLVPGRHARVSDFLIDAVAGCCGVVAAAAAGRLARQN